MYMRISWQSFRTVREGKSAGHGPTGKVHVKMVCAYLWQMYYITSPPVVCVCLMSCVCRTHTWLMWQTKLICHTTHPPEIKHQRRPPSMSCRRVHSSSVHSRCSVRRYGSLILCIGIHCRVSSGPTAPTCGKWCLRKKQRWRFDETQTCSSGMLD